MNPVLRHMLAVHMRIYVLFWTIVPTMVLVYAFLTSRLPGRQLSLWEVLQSPPKYLLLVAGIVAANAWLPIYVGNGVTRRVYAGAVAVLYDGTVAVFGLLAMLLYLLDRAVRPDSVTLPPSHAGWLLVQASLLYLVWGTSGWLMGAGFYRYGTWIGILLIPVFSVVVFIGEAVLSAAAFLDPVRPGQNLHDLVSAGPMAPALASAVGLGVAAIAMAVGWLLVRDVPIRKVSG